MTRDTCRGLGLAAAISLAAAVAPQTSWADDEIPFDEAELFFELNDTDGDFGIHAKIDGEAWKMLAIEAPNERRILNVRTGGSLRQQGLTELFFESDEPSFDELDPEEFFERFPEGIYEIEGVTLEGDELESEVEITHLIPAPAENIQISGEPAAEDCDADPLPSVSGAVVIRWDEVTETHEELGVEGDIEIVRQELVVEREEPELLVFHVDLPPNVTEFEVPQDFIDLGEEFKFEILVQEASGNRTAVESCFEVE